MVADSASHDFGMVLFPVRLGSSCV
jgi:hypothetical protein